MLGHFVIRLEFVIPTKFEMHAEDAIVSHVRRTLQKVQENFPFHYSELTQMLFNGYGGGALFPKVK